MKTRLVLNDADSTAVNDVKSFVAMTDTSVRCGILLDKRFSLLNEKSMRPTKILPLHSMSKMKSLKPQKLCKI